MSPQQILDYWFGPRLRQHWFSSTPELDAEIRERFEATWEAARDGRLADWEQTAAGALALVIVLDQFPLNMYRGRPESFSTEAAARAVAGRAIQRGLDRELDAEGQRFLYLPYVHSEDLDDQDRAVALVAASKMTDNCAEHHREIIRRFGRFPHRNAILGRDSTPEELAWLASPEGFNP